MEGDFPIALGQFNWFLKLIEHLKTVYPITLNCRCQDFNRYIYSCLYAAHLCLRGPVEDQRFSATQYCRDPVTENDEYKNQAGSSNGGVYLQTSKPPIASLGRLQMTKTATIPPQIFARQKSAARLRLKLHFFFFSKISNENFN